jgi:hypothetical protein
MSDNVAVAPRWRTYHILEWAGHIPPDIEENPGPAQILCEAICHEAGVMSMDAQGEMSVGVKFANGEFFFLDGVSFYEPTWIAFKGIYPDTREATVFRRVEDIDWQLVTSPRPGHIEDRVFIKVKSPKH